MRKILILANNDVGLYKFRKELIEELLKENEVYISLPYGEFVPLLEKIGCKFINTAVNRRSKNPINDLKLFMQYRALVRNIRPDVVLTYTIKPNIYGGLACRLAQVPYLVNITGLGTALEQGGLLQKITMVLYKFALKRARCTFFQNSENKKFFERNNMLKSFYRLIPGSGVNLEDYTLLDYPTSNTVEFLFIARIMKEKGIDQYLDAAKSIKKRYPNTVFHIVGPCEQDNYESILKEMQTKGLVQYHGSQKEVQKYYAITHCIIHPTYYPEGMSNVLLEAAASGRPIITTKKSGCKEVINDGISGFLIEERNSNELIRKIENFLNIDNRTRKEMGINGRTKVEIEFDRKLIVRSYMEEIEKVFKNKKF